MRFVLACALALLLSACVPIPHKEQVWKESPVSDEGQQAAAPGRRIAYGDTVRVQTKKGQTHKLRVDEIDRDGFHGFAKDRKRYRMNYADLTSMWVLRNEDSVVWMPVGVHPTGSRIGHKSGGGGMGFALLALLAVAGLCRHRPGAFIK
jgi:hypothetical protein